MRESIGIVPHSIALVLRGVLDGEAAPGLNAAGEAAGFGGGGMHVPGRLHLLGTRGRAGGGGEVTQL